MTGTIHHDIGLVHGHLSRRQRRLNVVARREEGIRLAGQYSSSRMEAAAERALATGTSRCQVRLKLC